MHFNLDRNKQLHEALSEETEDLVLLLAAMMQEQALNNKVIHLPVK